MNPLAQQQIEDPGVYRAYPIAWTVEKAKNTPSIAIVFQFAISQRWDPDETGGGSWSAEFPQGWFTYGRAWIVGKEGQLNAESCDNLKRAGLWDGDFDAIQTQPPPNVFCLLTMEQREFGGKVRNECRWIAPDADAPEARPSGFRPADPSLLQLLRSQYAGQVRAAMGGAPGGRPPAPGQQQPARPAAPAPAAPAQRVAPQARPPAPASPLRAPAPAAPEQPAAQNPPVEFDPGQTPF